MKKVCLFIGAGGSLGSAFCALYAAKYDIVAVARERFPDVPSQHERRIDPLAPSSTLPENAHAVFAVRADVAAPGQIERVVELALARHGRIDVVVSSAYHIVRANMLDDDRLEASAEAQLHLNVVVPLKVALAVARGFWRGKVDENRARNRCVINVSSISGINVYPHLGQSVYSASKAALNFLTCHMAAELAVIGVRVAATAPTTFPALIPTETAAGSIDRLIDSDVTGRVLVIDQDREYYTP